MKSFFITGTDTNVGKTVVSTLFAMHAALGSHRVCYHKPVQTGCEQDSDAASVAQLTKGLGVTTSCGIGFKKPLSPHSAASYENRHIDLSVVVATTRAHARGDLTIIEGAGGLLVPMNDQHFMIDLIKELAIPCIIVARSTLGTINHTLLSLEALRARNIPVWGVVMVGPPNRDNEKAVKDYGHINNFLALPWLPQLDQPSLADLVHNKQREIDTFLGLKKNHDH